MRQSCITKAGGHLALLGAFLPLVLGDAAELRAIYQPECDGNNQGAVDDCQSAINALWGFRGGVRIETGCIDVVESGGCVIETCDMGGGGGTSIDYMAVAAAAQNILAFCRDDEKMTTGGQTKVEGMEQVGQGHSWGQVKLRAPLTGGPPDVQQRRVKGRAEERGAAGDWKDVEIRPREEERRRRYADENHPGGSPYVEVEYSLFRGNEASLPSDRMLLPQDQTLIRDTMVGEWNRRSGSFWRPFDRRRTVGVEVVVGDLRYNMAIVAHGRRHASEFPIADRPGIVDAFLRLHQDEGYPQVMTGYVHETTGEVTGMITLTVNRVITAPVPERQLLIGPGSL
ncbi:hypothetical protein V8F33_013955 [Rhypophila sp. PSN 637]